MTEISSQTKQAKLDKKGLFNLVNQLRMGTGLVNSVTLNQYLREMSELNSGAESGLDLLINASKYFSNHLSDGIGLPGAGSSSILSNLSVEDLSDDVDDQSLGEIADVLCSPFTIRLGGVSCQYLPLSKRIKLCKSDWDILPFIINTDVNNYKNSTGVWTVSGVNLIVGAANTGKSPLADRLAEGGDRVARINLHEPHSGYGMSIERALFMLCSHLLEGKTDLVIDSVKSLISSGGSAMKGGLSREAFVDISNLSILGIACGVRMLVPLNPGSADPAVMNEAVQNGKSSASSTIWSTGDGTWQALTRSGALNKRSSVEFAFDMNGVIKVLASDDNVASAKFVLGKRPADYTITGTPADPDETFMTRELKTRKNLRSDSDLD